MYFGSFLKKHPTCVWRGVWGPKNNLNSYFGRKAFAHRKLYIIEMLDNPAGNLFWLNRQVTHLFCRKEMLVVVGIHDSGFDFRYPNSRNEGV